MDTDRIQWITPELGIFGGRFTSSPLERIRTDRIVFGLATDTKETTHGPSDIAGVSLSWNRTEDQKKSMLDLTNQDEIHRFNTEAFYGFQISETMTIQPSLAVMADSLGTDPEFTAHIGLHLRF
jgi:hypothetical protein